MCPWISILARGQIISHFGGIFAFATCGESDSVGSLWCSGSCSRLVIRGSWVRMPLDAYAPRQGILSTNVSLIPGVVNGYPAGIFLEMHCAPLGCRG